MKRTKDIYLRKNTAEQYRKMRDILRNTIPEPKDPPPKPFSWWKIALIIGILGGILWALSGCAMASNIPDNKAILAIIGEAEGEGYRGMLAVACAIRNRGHLGGVYGLKAPRVVKKLYSMATYKNAQRAWQESAFSDIVGGADHWEGTKFKKPAWAKGMIKTITIGNQAFYKKRGA